MSNYVELEIPEEQRPEAATVVYTWLKDGFGPVEAPDLLLVGSALYEVLLEAYPSREIGRSITRFRPADDKASPWRAWGYYHRNLHPKVEQLEKDNLSLSNIIARNKAMVEEAERIKKIHDGHVALEFSMRVPADIVSLVVMENESLTKQMESAILARVKNDSKEMRTIMRLMAPTPINGYNHAFMEAIHMLSGPLAEKLGDVLAGMLHEFMKEKRADRDSRNDTPVA